MHLVRSPPRTHAKDSVSRSQAAHLGNSLDNKRPHLAVRHTYHFGKLLFIQWQRNDKHDIVFGFGELFSVLTIMFFPVGLSLSFTVFFRPSLNYFTGIMFSRIAFSLYINQIVLFVFNL